jgi:hypothetical protein
MTGPAGPYRPRDRKTPEQISLDHFRAVYQTLDSAGIARRCALPFLGEKSAFALRIMGSEYLVPFPDFDLLPLPGNGPPPGSKAPRDDERILFLRYLCEGKYTEALGKQLSYREIPWGELYYRNFEGRCIRHLARTFGNDPELFRKVMEGNPGLRAQRLDRGKPDLPPPDGGASGPVTHLGYRFEFCSGLYMSFLIWAADEEFPPSAQILFDDNIPAAFTAEDLAVACGAAVGRLKDMAAGE